MNRLLKVLGGAVLAGLALVLVVAAAGAVWGWPDLGHAAFNLDGDTFEVSSLGFGALLVGGLVAVFAMLLAIAVPLLAVAFGLGVALLVLLAVGGALMSPLLVLAGLAWLVWRLVRKPAADATMRR